MLHLSDPSHSSNHYLQSMSDIEFKERLLACYRNTRWG